MRQANHLKAFITFPDIVIMFCLFLLGAVFTVWHGGAWQIWLSVVIGMVGYVFSEYMTHRFVFHMKPPKNPWMLRFMKRIHYDHHADPNDLHLLFLPIWYSLPNLAVACGIFVLISHQWTDTAAFATGISGSLLFYEWKHYIAHRPIVPKTPWGRAVKKAHLWHHFKNENYWYGVTNSAMDVLLGTYKDATTVPKSQTAKDLEHRYHDITPGM